jgi:hypothetical protein
MLENEIFAKENIQRIYSELGDVYVDYRMMDNGKIINRRVLLKKEGNFEDMKKYFSMIKGVNK